MIDNTGTDNNLSIISVYHNALSKRLLELNYEITRRFNPGMPLTWFVADNTPDGFTDKIDAQKFIVVPNTTDYHGLGSHQHAGGINACLTQIKTRFMLSLDSDFYIVRKHWIRDVLVFMQERNLSFFGVTYHPRDYPKYRYFPSVVCMFVDLKKVPLSSLDFMPQYAITQEGHVIRTDKDRDTRKKIMRKKIKSIVGVHTRTMTMLGRIMRTLDIGSRRLNIAGARDTSYRIYARYGHDVTYKRAYVQPVFNPAQENALHGRVCLPFNRFVEALLPDSLCYIPKKSEFFSISGFHEMGFADCAGYGWEEYIWQGQPFGTHIRGSKTWKRNPNEDDELSLIIKTLGEF